MLTYGWEIDDRLAAEPDLILLDDADLGLSTRQEIGGGACKLPDNRGTRRFAVGDARCDGERVMHQQPEEIASNDPEVLRAALIREVHERRRAECRASMQTQVVKLALDLLVREPDIEGFFGAFAKTVVEESDSHTCGVWLIDESGQHCDLWMAYVKDQLYTPRKDDWGKGADPAKRLACECLAQHLFDYRPGWSETVEYLVDDARLPDLVRAFTRRMGSAAMVAAPLVLGSRNLGWMTVSSPGTPDTDDQWWRVALIDAVARQAALALYQSRLIDENRREERRKAILEERNRLARDIHDNLAQGFAAILMQLQAARREAGEALPPAISSSVDTAVELARTHLAEARRSVGALRPNIGQGEDIASALKRLADMGQRTANAPIDLVLEELPRLGDVVEREIIGIAQEALTNAVRHARAERITIRASAVQEVGLRLSIADDGRGIAGDRSGAGFGLTSMQERADRIGASLTIVTAPRSGTEVVLAWEPTSLPARVHLAT